MPASESRMPASSSTMRMLCMLGDHGRWRRFRHHGKFYDEACADRMILFHANRAMMILHDAAHDRKAQARAPLLRGEIWQEQLLLHIAGDAMTGIRDTDFHGVAAADQR